MATVHLICGFLGNGKTTYAVDVADRLGAVRFSVDELYLGLFADGPTYDLDQRALDRLIAVLATLWPQVVDRGVDVVLDFGFWSRRFRDEVRQMARQHGADTRLHWLRCPDDVALERCLRRNGRPGAFLISEAGFRELLTRFEAPGPEESPVLIERPISESASRQPPIPG